MADVTVISSSIVQPGHKTQSCREKIHLTSSDLNLLYFDYCQRGLLFHKPDPETHFISRLKSSLSVALDIYFPFAGRLVKVNNQEDNTVSFYVDCNNNGLGARFIHAIAESVSVTDLLQPDGFVPEFLKCFFPSNGVKSIDGISKPLLALQVTEIKDGVFISFGYNHMVADGASVWSFFLTWSKICSSGSCSDHQPLVLKGWFLDRIDYPIHIPVSEIETPLLPNHALTSVSIMKDRVIHFTKKKISDLKAKADGEISSSDLKISSLQVVVAHLWRLIAKHSSLNQEEKSYCGLAADFRQRLNPPLEKECFGNITYGGIATATVGGLVDHGLGWAALQISKMVRSLTSEYYTSSAEKWVRNVKIPKFGVVSSDFVSIFSSPWFQVYDNDFGWGKPIAARAGPSTIGGGGKLVVFRGVEDGSIDVHVTLLSDVLVKLLADDV